MEEPLSIAMITSIDILYNLCSVIRGVAVCVLCYFIYRAFRSREARSRLTYAVVGISTYAISMVARLGLVWLYLASPPDKIGFVQLPPFIL
jgi:uncharacterized membrane protein YwaF